MVRDLEERFWEIDFLRGIAIIMMIIFHLLFDINYFGSQSYEMYSGFWLYFARASATLFLLLVGVSLTLSYSRARLKGTGAKLYPKYIGRGLKIFSWGIIITAMTWVFLREGFIIFGVLHFIGVAVILVYPFLGLRHLNLLFGVIFISFGLYLKNFSFDFPWLLWLGFMPEGLYTLDYFPVFPWLGVVLLGLWLGNLGYENYERKFSLPEISGHFPVRLFSALGRNSLLIYLAHQPLLIAVLYLLGVVEV